VPRRLVLVARERLGSREGSTWVRCDGSSPASCECHVADERTDFVVNGPAADPCALVARSCVQTPADELPPPLCEPLEAEAYADSCWVDARCTRAVVLDGGVTLARVSSHDRASCSLADGRWDCRCDIPNGYVELDLPDTATSTAICDEAIRRCFHDELTVVVGRTCTTEYVQASDADCQTGLPERGRHRRGAFRVAAPRLLVRGRRPRLPVLGFLPAPGNGRSGWRSLVGLPGDRGALPLGALALTLSEPGRDARVWVSAPPSRALAPGRRS